MIVRFTAILIFIALVAASAVAEPTPAPGVAEPTPAATFMPIPPPPSSTPSALPAGGPKRASAISTPQPPPPANLLTYTGQLLDVRGDYVYFTTGVAFAAGDPLRIVTFETGAITTVPPATKMYARATFDATTHKIIELAITSHRLPVTQTTSALVGFAVVKSQKTAAE